MTEQIPTVIDTLYTMVSVPAESTAFLGTGNAQILITVAPVVLAIHSDRVELQEALNIAAILIQLCRVELANQLLASLYCQTHADGCWWSSVYG